MVSFVWQHTANRLDSALGLRPWAGTDLPQVQGNLPAQLTGQFAQVPNALTHRGIIEAFAPCPAPRPQRQTHAGGSTRATVQGLPCPARNRHCHPITTLCPALPASFVASSQGDSGDLIRFAKH